MTTLFEPARRRRTLCHIRVIGNFVKLQACWDVKEFAVQIQRS